VVQAPSDQTVIYYLRSPSGARRISAERVLKSLDHLEIFEMKPGVLYELLVASEDGLLLERREFAALDTSKRSARLAVVSCMDDSFEEVQAGMWSDLIAQKPDAVLMIGDNAYADRGPGEGFERIFRRYHETRSKLAY